MFQLIFFHSVLLLIPNHLKISQRNHCELVLRVLNESCKGVADVRDDGDT